MQVDRAGGSATVSISVLPGVYSSNLGRVCQGYAILSLSDSKSFCATSWTEVCGWVADILRVSNPCKERCVEQEVKVMPCTCKGTTSLSTSTAIFAGSSGKRCGSEELVVAFIRYTQMGGLVVLPVTAKAEPVRPGRNLCRRFGSAAFRRRIALCIALLSSALADHCLFGEAVPMSSSMSSGVCVRNSCVGIVKTDTAQLFV